MGLSAVSHNKRNGSCSTKNKFGGGRKSNHRTRRNKSHRNKSHRNKSHRRKRRGGGAIGRFLVPASLYGLKQLMAKKSSGKFVSGVDKSLGRPGTTIIKDVTKGFVGAVDTVGSIVGLKKSRRKSSRRKSSRRKSKK